LGPRSKRRESILIIRILIPGIKTMVNSRVILQSRVLVDGTAVPIARDSKPRIVVPSCRARKSTNLALDPPFRQIIAHLMLSNVAAIVADNDTPAISEKARRKKME
jgi:hypothetical protein